MSFTRHIVTVGGATVVSRVLGFARDMAIAAIFGTAARAEAFVVAFQLVNLCRRLLGEGALNAAVVPLYLRARDAGGELAASAFAGRLIGSFTLVLSAIVVFLGLAMPLLMALLAPGFVAEGPRLSIAVELARLMLPYLALAGPIAVMAGVLNANHRYGMAALAAAAFNAVMLAALAIVFILQTGDSELSARVIAASVAVAGLAQLLLVATAIWMGPERVMPLGVTFGPHMRRFFALAFPGLVASGIPQITMVVGVMVASAQPHAVSWLYYANRLIELPLGIVGIAIGTVLLPALTHAIRSGDPEATASAQARALELALGLTLPAALALAILSEPIVRVLFERGAFTAADTAATASALAIFALGLPGHVLVKVFSPVFFAREDTATPMRAGLAGVGAAFIGSLALLPLLGYGGVALAIALSAWLSAAILALLIIRRAGFSLDRSACGRLLRIGLAAAGMAAAVKAVTLYVPPFFALHRGADAFLLGVMVTGGLALYAALLHGLGVVRVSELSRAVRLRS